MQRSIAPWSDVEYALAAELRYSVRQRLMLVRHGLRGRALRTLVYVVGVEGLTGVGVSFGAMLPPVVVEPRPSAG